MNALGILFIGIILVGALVFLLRKAHDHPLIGKVGDRRSDDRNVDKH